MTNLDPNIADYYATTDERGRLNHGLFQLEKARTRRILERYVPERSRILDVGGGAGAYAFELAEGGHEVHLVDASAHLVDQARDHDSAIGHRLASLRQGDARSLSHVADGGFDAVLLLGPLYHLVTREDRLRALREAWRVLAQGGVLLAAAISRYASLLAGLQEGMVFDDGDFDEIVERDLASGQHRNGTGNDRYFTTAFFHHPQELEAEIREGGFQLEALLAVEGPAIAIPDFERRWSEPVARRRLLRCIETVEAEPSLLGASAHMIAIGHRGRPEEVSPSPL